MIDWWLINSRNLFFTVWRLEVWDEGCSMVQFWWELPSRLQTLFFSCLHRVESKRGSKLCCDLLGHVLSRGLTLWIHLILITAQRPYLLVPSHQEVGFEFRGAQTLTITSFTSYVSVLCVLCLHESIFPKGKQLNYFTSMSVSSYGHLKKPNRCYSSCCRHLTF